MAEIQTYAAANAYLEKTFQPDFNRRFTVRPAQAESAFTPIAGVDLDLLVSIRHDRTARKDNTVVFEKLSLQLPESKDRRHFARCPVVVHEFVDGSLGVSFQGTLLARFGRDGELIKPRSRQKTAA